MIELLLSALNIFNFVMPQPSTAELLCHSDSHHTLYPFQDELGQLQH